MYQIPVIRVAQRTMAILLASNPEFNHRNEQAWPTQEQAMAFWQQKGIPVDPKRLLARPSPQVAAVVNPLLASCKVRKYRANGDPLTLEDIFQFEQDLMHVGT